ncbi:hypothetical protein [Pseudomonas sp.]|uniref:hypothetical protein n=1 Tax=Pseudomonas sp. TaxID=306 RepID=UPI0025DFC5D4|nr:hypothetical protein [Pseudomonas sp.]
MGAHVIISGATEYRRFPAEAARHRYAVRFPTLVERRELCPTAYGEADEDLLGEVDVELATAIDAPRALADEMSDLIRFKTATLTDIGRQRNGVWNEPIAFQKIEHLGLLFGALAASPKSAVRGLGVSRDGLALGLLVVPAVWDWYVQWRERRRGFYTVGRPT